MLAPLLLLLSQDLLILPMLGEQQRYFPSGLALVTYLALSAIMQASLWFLSQEPSSEDSRLKAGIDSVIEILNPEASKRPENPKQWCGCSLTVVTPFPPATIGLCVFSPAMLTGSGLQPVVSDPTSTLALSSHRKLKI